MSTKQFILCSFHKESHRVGGQSYGLHDLLHLQYGGGLHSNTRVHVQVLKKMLCLLVCACSCQPVKMKLECKNDNGVSSVVELEVIELSTSLHSAYKS